MRCHFPPSSPPPNSCAHVDLDSQQFSGDLLLESLSKAHSHSLVASIGGDRCRHVQRIQCPQHCHSGPPFAEFGENFLVRLVHVQLDMNPVDAVSRAIETQASTGVDVVKLGALRLQERLPGRCINRHYCGSR